MNTVAGVWSGHSTIKVWCDKYPIVDEVMGSAQSQILDFFNLAVKYNTKITQTTGPILVTKLI